MEGVALADETAADRARVTIGRPGREHQIGLALGPTHGGAGRLPPGRAGRRAPTVPGGLGMRAAEPAIGVGTAKVPAREGEELRTTAEAAVGAQRHNPLSI